MNKTEALGMFGVFSVMGGQGRTCVAQRARWLVIGALRSLHIIDAHPAANPPQAFSLLCGDPKKKIPPLKPTACIPLSFARGAAECFIGMGEEEEATF